jgi:hypothetical protein
VAKESNKLTHEVTGQESPFLKILNPSGLPNLVILFPVTRVGLDAEKRWSALISTINASQVSALIVIDKTGNGTAREFFNAHARDLNTRLYIIQREPLEPIFDSQKYVLLDEMLWIQQIHDDDTWEGLLSVPSSAEKSDLFLVQFHSGSALSVTTINDEKAPPARVIFSAIPAVVWNRFSAFICAQGGHVAGSMDSTLSAVALIICNLKLLPNFNYFYSSHHWSRRSEADSHLKSLSFTDGWNELSSTEIAILNRLYDNLSALNFFSDLIPHRKIIEAQELLLSSCRPRLNKKLQFLFSYALANYFLVPLFKVINWIGIRSISSRVRHYEESAKLNRLLIRSVKADSLPKILQFIEANFSGRVMPKLAARFDFWHREISALEKISG